MRCTTKMEAKLHLVSLSNHEERLEKGPPILMLNAFHISQDVAVEPEGLDTPLELDMQVWSFENNLQIRYVVDSSYGAVFSSCNFSLTLMWIREVSLNLFHTASKVSHTTNCQTEVPSQTPEPDQLCYRVTKNTFEKAKLSYAANYHVYLLLAYITLEVDPKLCVKLVKKFYLHALPYKPALKRLFKTGVIKQLVSRQSSEWKTSSDPLKISRDFRVGAAGFSATVIALCMANQWSMYCDLTAVLNTHSTTVKETGV